MKVKIIAKTGDKTEEFIVTYSKAEVIEACEGYRDQFGEDCPSEKDGITYRLSVIECSSTYDSLDFEILESNEEERHNEQ